ncbi:MAG: ArsC family reductase [Rhizobiales bacterium]|nr:ArsC family reductase [Hyphomicrobiales bacterium]
MTITIYGIKNCDTMKRARAWLDSHGVAYTFHDYKAAGIERERLERWARNVGWGVLLNRTGTTFRKLPDKDKQAIDARKAIALMLAQPSLIKRPVLDLGHDRLLVGFKAELYEESVRGRRSAAIFRSPGIARRRRTSRN